MFQGLFDLREIDLVEPVRVGEQFVVVQLDEERNFVRVFAGHRAKDAERGGDGVAAAFHGELDDVFRVEIIRVVRKAGAGGMFDALVHRQDGHVTRAGQPAVAEQRLQAAQRLRIAVGQRENAVHEIRSRQVQPLFGHGLCIYVPGGLWRNPPSNFSISAFIVYQLKFPNLARIEPFQGVKFNRFGATNASSIFRCEQHKVRHRPRLVSFCELVTGFCHGWRKKDCSTDDRLPAKRAHLDPVLEAGRDIALRCPRPRTSGRNERQSLREPLRR